MILSQSAIALNRLLQSIQQGTASLNPKHMLTKSKCSVIQVGRKSNGIELKLHEEKIYNTESAVYFGEVIHKSGKAKFNINEKCNILQDVPSGTYQTKVGLQLRQAMFVKGFSLNRPTGPIQS